MKNSDFIRGKNTGEFGFFFNYLIEFIEIEIDLINNDDGTFKERIIGFAKIPRTAIIGEYSNNSTDRVSVTIFDASKESIGSEMYSDWNKECESIVNKTISSSKLNYQSFSNINKVYGYSKLKIYGNDNGFCHIAIDGNFYEKLLNLLHEDKLSSLNMSIEYYNIFDLINTQSNSNVIGYVINEEQFREGETVGAIKEVKIVASNVKLNSNNNSELLKVNSSNDDSKIYLKKLLENSEFINKKILYGIGTIALILIISLVFK